MNREKRTIILSGIAVVVASLLFLYFYTGEPPVTNVGVQVGSNQTQGSSDAIDMSDELLRSQVLMTASKDPLNFTDNVRVAVGHGGGVSTSGHHGGGGGGGGGGGSGNLFHSYSLLLNSTEIPVGSGIAGTASTNNTAIKNVMFLWKDPAGIVSANHNRTTTNGNANDAFTAPIPTGLWTVEAHFLDNANKDLSNVTQNFVVIQPGGAQSAYRVIVNPNPVAQNAQINATATTSNNGITKVKFEWIFITSGTTKTIKATHERPLNPTSLSALDSFTPDIIGDWKVVAHFNNATHSDVAIKFANFTAIDKTPPVVKGVFSRDPDLEDSSKILWYIRPVTITWLCEDVGGSGVRSVDLPLNYAGPNGLGIVSEGKCRDNAGNNGTGSVTFNYDSSGGTTGRLTHFYDLTLSSNSVSLGSSISANATTNNTSIKNVKFLWTNPSNVTVATNVVPTVGNDGIRFAVNVFAGLDQAGTWTVDAHFLDNATNDVIDVTRFFAVVQKGGGLFAYDLTVSPDTVVKNDQVKANATTNNPSITNVTFVWTNPAHAAVSKVVPMPSAGGNSLFRSAIDLLSPNVIGKWRVDAHFNNATHLDVGLDFAFFTVREGGGGGSGNHAPVAIDDKTTTLEDTPVVINILTNDTDADGDVMTVSSFTQPEHGSVTQNANGTFTYSPNENFNGQDTFTYRISDGKLQSNSATVTVLVTPIDHPINHPPIANAGRDQIVNERSHVDLSGLGSSDPDGDALSYSWKQTGGPTIELNDANSATPSFTAPPTDVDTDLTLELTVSDGFGGKSSDSVKITVLDTSEGDRGDKDSKKFTGGGGIGEKISFGFVVQSSHGEVKGNLEYHDKATDINVHSISIRALKLHEDNIATFKGIATMNAVGEHAFVIMVQDNGSGDKDWFSIEIPDLGYLKEGTLTKGNIQIH